MKSYTYHAILIAMLSLCAPFAMASPDEIRPENEFKCHVKRTDYMPDIVLIQTTTLSRASAVSKDLSIEKNGIHHGVAEVIECTGINDRFSSKAANKFFSRMPL